MCSPECFWPGHLQANVGRPEGVCGHGNYRNTQPISKLVRCKRGAGTQVQHRDQVGRGAEHRVWLQGGAEELVLVAYFVSKFQCLVRSRATYLVAQDKSARVDHTVSVVVAVIVMERLQSCCTYRPASLDFTLHIDHLSLV